MTRESINGERYLKRKISTPLTTEENKKILNGDIVMSHYATEYLYYKIIK